MSLHKLTAGDGYSYLTRQVAVLDATDRGHTGLADYYAERGESPGVWLGSALPDVDLQPGQEVTADQMASLFAEGRHPNADAIAAQLASPVQDGAEQPDPPARLSRPCWRADVEAATRLGRPFPVLDAAPGFRVEVAQRCAQVNAGLGRRPDSPLAAAERAQVRTDVGRAMFASQYGRAPKDPRELSSFIARHSRQATTAVAGFDLTFTPVKSVSAVWAIASPQVAAQIRAAHRAAVQDALAWLERDAIYTRGGHAGVQQLDTTGMIAAAFEHRDSRAGDPNLHTHVAVSSKVRVATTPTTGGSTITSGGVGPLAGGQGRWLALDGRVLFKAAVTASERYNTRIEAELYARLGMTFTERSDAPAAVISGRRTVREITGVPERLLGAWSTRRAAIDARRAQLAAEFQDHHGRPPTPVEAVKLAQQATLETRDAKHSPRSETQQRQHWRAQAAAVLGGEQAVTALVDTLTTPRPGPVTPAVTPVAGVTDGVTPVTTAVTPVTPLTGVAALDPVTVRSVVADTKAVIESRRSTWQVWHVRSEAERQTRHTAPPGTDVDALVEHVVAAVLHPDHSIPLGPGDPVTVPQVLRRADGVSVYEVAGARLYTSATVLADEAYLVHAATQYGGRAATDTDVDLALLESVANGVTLNTAQAHLVRQLATSGARVQLAIAPAGSGKTTAMAALSAAWTSSGAGSGAGSGSGSGSGGTVLGLAPSAVAAGILGQETGAHADTLAKLVWGITHHQLPPWAAAVDQDTLIVVDEAGMAATADLAVVTRFALDRGASIRLVGDDRQLASVAAGGVLRDIQATAGAVTLSELVRFADQGDGAASLAIRAGDTTGIGFYLDHDRVHVGDLTTATDAAYAAWATDRAAGLDSLMLAPTRELTTALNIRARTDRLSRLSRLNRLNQLNQLDQLDRADPVNRLANPVGDPGVEVMLVDGSAASAGDVIITRRNNRALRTSGTPTDGPRTAGEDFVKNGDRWTVTAARDDGSLQVVNTRTGRDTVLPAAYVAGHVQLGYATTVHGGQGVTADTSHTVAVGGESRQQLYVALTRGRDANNIYLAVTGDGDEHSVITPAVTHPLTAVNVLEQILARDEAQVSATTTSRRLADPAIDAAAAAARYSDSLHTAAAHLLGPGWGHHLDAALDQACPGITDSPAYPTLRGHLALLAANGEDPVVAFTQARTSREIDTAADVAAVLDWRLDPTHTHTPSHPLSRASSASSASSASDDGSGPLAWLPGIPRSLAADPYWGSYLLARHRHVTRATTAVRGQAAGYTAATAPAWARQLLHPDHQGLLADLAVFRAAHAIPDDDTRPTGPRQLAAADRRAQHHLDRSVAATLDTGHLSAWTAVAEQVGLTPATDPHWPGLVHNLAALSRAGADASALLRAAAAEKPLPDEYRAAAIWWRIAGQVSPAVLTTDRDLAPTGPLRPDWLPTLIAALNTSTDPTEVAPNTMERLVDDPRWPAVVTAIARARQHGVPLTDLVRTPTGVDGSPVPDHALADALIYRALTLTDPPPVDPDYPNFEPDCPDDPQNADQVAPKDLHLLATTVDPSTALHLAGPRPDRRDDDSHDGDSHAAAGTALPEGELQEELFHAARARLWLPVWEPTDDQQERQLARAAAAEFSSVTPERVADLNEQAVAFYEQRYPGSWAQSYLTDRLGGTDLTGDPHTRPGYAPTGWTALTTHLREGGATDEELLAAGLAKQASTGRLIDTFRDRLVLPIHHHTRHTEPAQPEQQRQVIGFVGRRNPATDHLHDVRRGGTGNTVRDVARDGPKYLNTAETVLFAKGRQLYGMAEHADRLTNGATPVLVEGPLDALAVTLTGPDHVGVAPLGTALTDTQADTLIPYLDTAAGAPGVIVATDADPAGRRAAERDYWLITARGGDPRQPALPPGLDPAEVIRTTGPAALRDLLHTSGALADALIRERLADPTPVEALREALSIVAAGHARYWDTRTGDIASSLHVPTGVALINLLAQITAWDTDRRASSARLIHCGGTTHAGTRGRTTQSPAPRWAPHTRHTHPGLIAANDKVALAANTDSTHQAKGNVAAALLPVLPARPPFSSDHPAKDPRTYPIEPVDLTDPFEDLPAPPDPLPSTHSSRRPRATHQTSAPTRRPDNTIRP